MVIIFQSEKARAYLLQNTGIFTFRKNLRKKLGIDWMTDQRGHKKIADVFIEGGSRKFHPDELKEYVESSGFSSLQEWVEEIKTLNNGELPEKGWLYLVTLLKGGP